MISITLIIIIIIIIIIIVIVIVIEIGMFVLRIVHRHVHTSVCSPPQWQLVCRANDQPMDMSVISHVFVFFSKPIQSILIV